MKNISSKVLILVVGLVAMGAALCAKAQVPTYSEQVIVSGVALLPGTATNLGTPSTATYQSGVIMDVRKQAKVMVTITTTNTKPDAVNANILYYQRGLTGSSNTWETVLYPIGWTTSASSVNPAAPQVIMTNLDTLGCGYINFPYLTNAAGSLTNVGSFRLSYGVKISSP
jgi:hypothetical protein